MLKEVFDEFFAFPGGQLTAAFDQGRWMTGSPAPISAKPVKTSRTPAQHVGSVMAVLATFNDAGVLPPESSVQANQLIRALIQFQMVFVKSPEPAVREFLSSALIAQTGEQATMVFDRFALTGWTSQSLEAVVDYSQLYPMWENPTMENTFRAYNLSPEDWELVQTLFVKARQNLAHREKDFHAVFANHRSGMPGG